MALSLRTALAALMLCCASAAQAQNTYCSPTGYVDGRVKISHVHLAGRDVYTTTGGYLDSNQVQFDLFRSIDYSLIVDLPDNAALAPNICTAYIDWNYDGDFTDTLERYDLDQLNSGGHFGRRFHVPDLATATATRMRLICFYRQNGRVMNPCASTENGVDGSAQDYYLSIAPIPTAAPACPLILSPAASTMGVPPIPTISWQRVPDADRYLVRIDSTATGGSVTGTITRFEYETSVTLTSSLRGGRTYYLHVNAFNAAGTSSCAPIAFNTSSAPPPCPRVTAPAQGDNVARRFPINWVDTASYQRRYAIQLSIANPPTTIVASGISGGSYTTNLLPAGNAYLRVLATDDNGTSTGCPVIGLTVLDSIPYCVTSYTRGPLRLDSVQIGRISTTRGEGGIGYRDFSALTDSLVYGDTLHFFAKPNLGNLSPNTVRIYVDWNQDGLFAVDSEAINIPSQDNGTTFRGLVRVPLWALPGAHRARVVLVYVQGNQPIGPCGIQNFDGSAYDYTLVVKGVVIGVRPMAAGLVSSYPNPVPFGQSLTLATPLPSAATWSVTTLTGAQAAGATKLAAGASMLSCAGLPPGCYIGTLRTAVTAARMRFVVE